MGKATWLRRAVVGVAVVLLPWAAQAATLTTIYSFAGGSDGQTPSAPLLDVAGTLYGTTQSGGGTQCPNGNDCGTVFKINPATGAETVLHAFTGSPDGWGPVAAPIDVGGTLYGTTQRGGTSDAGTVYWVNPKNGHEKVLYSFTGYDDGGYPNAALVDVGGTLYGATGAGGTAADGTVFEIDRATGAETVVYSFQGGTDGRYPLAGLIDVGGILYGTTEMGGASNDGTVFKIDPGTGMETVLHAFKGGKDGDSPVAPLIDVAGTLYGTTQGGGGSSGNGTVFGIDPATGAETVLDGFGDSSKDGENPDAAVLDVGGTLYGTTVLGGAGDSGTIFRIDPATGAEKVLHAFGAISEGLLPVTPLIEAGAALYGTTVGGGASGGTSDNNGTVFRFVP